MSTSCGRRSLRVVIPRPDRIRRIGSAGFGWLDARLRTHGWLKLLSPQALSTYAFLCLVADRSGTSWYRRDRIQNELGLHEDQLHTALDRLLDLELIAYRPFGRHASDGFRQVLSLPEGAAPSIEELILGSVQD